MDPRAYLWDAGESADAIASFVRGRTFDDYCADMMLRSRSSGSSSGKRCGGSKRPHPISRLRLPERAKAIAFRNILIHGYDSIDDAIVWRTIHESLPALRARLAALLDEAGNA